MNPDPLPPSRPIRTLIVDDEPAARRGVRLLLQQDEDIDIIGEAGDGPQAAEWIRRERPELVFLDVQMPGGDAFETLQRAGPPPLPVVVFVTAYNEHALRAFEVHAVDYLLKPYDDQRFLSALQRAKEAVRQRHHEAAGSRLSRLLDYLQSRVDQPADAATDRIFIKSSGEIFFLRTTEIDWIEAEGDYMKFHAAGRSHLMRETMARLEARLDPRRFIRIHRSTIVNIDRVRKLSPAFGGDYVVILQDGTKLKLSRGYQDRITPLLRDPA